MGKEDGRNKINGQITILAGLVFGLLVSLLVVMIESAACTGAKTRINSIVNLGVQSLFSQFSRPVLDKYEVFGGVISQENEVISSLYGYIDQNCQVTNELLDYRAFDPFGIKVGGINIEELELLTDNNGENFYNEITGYMKYGQFDSDILSFLPEMMESSKQKNIEAVSGELAARQEEASKIDAKILRLLMYVEGVKTTSAGFKQFFGNLTGAGSFVKKICPNGMGFGQTGVHNQQIYDAVSSKYYDITSELEQLKAELDWIKYVYNYPLTKEMFIDVGFRSVASGILDEVNSTAEKIAQSLELIEEIEADIEILSGNLGKSRNILAVNSVSLGEEVTTAFEQEFDELAKYKSGEMITLCNLDEVKEKLTGCQAVIGEMQVAVSNLANVYMDIYCIDSVYGEVDSCIAVCSQYNGAAIVFNYDGVSLGKGESLSAIKKIKDIFTNNILKLVVGDDVEISGKKISYNDLSSDKCMGNEIDWGIDLSSGKLYEDFLYNRYVKMNFSSFVNPHTDGILEYEMEYILGKSDKDKDNLKSVITELVAIRFTSDFTYIICDVAKKNECKSMAVTMLGFTGVHGIIKAGQYLLMAAWAYGEAINDARILVTGGKVPFKKTADTWKTKLTDIVSEEVGTDKTENLVGLNYGEYLQLMLFLENKQSKIYRTMDMMEINMIQAGYEHIRMYKYLYSLKGSVFFRYRNGEYEYTQNFDFSY